MKRACLLLVLATLAISGCPNVPKERRLNLGRDVEAADEAEKPRMREKLRRILLGENGRPDPDPHYRAAAAQGLGNLGAPDDVDALLEALMGIYADDNRMVRMEAAIAVGKLKFPDVTDRRRKNAIKSLTARLAFERDAASRLVEQDYLVRSAMINSLAALGHRDSASALHDVATRIVSDLQNVETLVFTGLGEEGLFDLCLAKLQELTRVEKAAADKDRASHDNIADHLKWWAERISEMPPVPLG